MILSTILKKQTGNLESTKAYIQNLSALLKMLNQLKSDKSISKKLKHKITSSLYSKFVFVQNKHSLNFKSKTVKKNLISYIINVNLSPTNTLVNVTDIDGNPKVSFSAGLVNLTKTQKRTQPMALISIFKALLINAKFLVNKPVAFFFKNTKPFYESLIIKALKDKLFIKSIQSYNLSPHNGCRPKKLKRIKRRTKRLVLR